MKGKILIIGLVFSLMLVAYLASGFGSEAKAADIDVKPCTMGSQAGKADLQMPEEVEGMQMMAIRFETAFCTNPVLIATGGENVEGVQVGVLTEQAAWLLVAAVPGAEVTVYWQALVPTQ